MQKYILLVGAVIILLGLLWPWVSKLPIGKLPGDIIIDKPNFKLYITNNYHADYQHSHSLIVWLFKK